MTCPFHTTQRMVSAAAMISNKGPESACACDSNPLRMPGLTRPQRLLFWEAAASNWVALNVIGFSLMPIVYLATQFSFILAPSAQKRSMRSYCSRPISPLIISSELPASRL